MKKSEKPQINIDAFAFTVIVDEQFIPLLHQNFDTVSSINAEQTGQGKIAASRYLCSIRIPLRRNPNSHCFGERKPIMWLQIEPISQYNAPLRIEFKGHPYEPAEYEYSAQIISSVLAGIPSIDIKYCVTRIDIAIATVGSLTDLYCHKMRTKICNVTFANGGELACLRHGKSSSNQYLTIYTKDYRPSRNSPLPNHKHIRVEMRFKPRVPLNTVISDLGIEERLANILIVNRKEIHKSGLFTRSQRMFARRYGITPLIMASDANGKRKIIRYLKKYNQELVKKSFLRKRMLEIQSQLNQIVNIGEIHNG